TPVHVHVEGRHEDADARRLGVEETVLTLRDDGDDAAVRGRDDRAVVGGRGALRVAEEPEAEAHREDERDDGDGTAGERADYGDGAEHPNRRGDNGPPF